jgi:D-alanine-D-alanine ligase
MTVTELDHVVVLAGGLSPERDVSLRSGRRVRDALEEAGVDARIADADAALIPSLLADRPSAVFPVIHGAYGEDGAIREILDLVGVPYVGSVASACRGAFDKPTAKALVAAAGIATPDSVALPREIFHDLGANAVIERVITRLGLPLFVKPARGGSSLGASPVRSAAELPTAIVSCFAYGDTALIERLIEGTEIAVSVVDLGDGPRPLPAVEIVPGAPARLPGAAADAAAKAATCAHSALGLRDISRTDLIVSDTGEVQFLEVNVSPGMTETSTLPMALDAAGHQFGPACLTLLNLAAGRGH